MKKKDADKQELNKCSNGIAAYLTNNKLLRLVEGLEKRFCPADNYLFKFNNGNTRAMSNVLGESLIFLSCKLHFQS